MIIIGSDDEENWSTSQSSTFWYEQPDSSKNAKAFSSEKTSKSTYISAPQPWLKRLQSRKKLSKSERNLSNWGQNKKSQTSSSSPFSSSPPAPSSFAFTYLFYEDMNRELRNALRVNLFIDFYLPFLLTNRWYTFMISLKYLEL